MMVRIDRVLLEALRTEGMSDRLIAIQAAGVLRHDARSVRAFHVAGPGEATFEDDVVMAPIRLAHGVHWCGGQLRMVQAQLSLPGTALASLEGMPLKAIVDHPAIPADVRITGVRHDDTSRFQVGGGPRNDPVDVTILETDAIAETLDFSVGMTAAAPFIRMWNDRETVRNVDDRSSTLRVMADYGLLGGVFGYWAHSDGWSITSSIAAGIMATFLWVVMGVISMSIGGKYVDDTHMPHVDYRAKARLAQREQGMRG